LIFNEHNDIIQFQVHCLVQKTCYYCCRCDFCSKWWKHNFIFAYKSWIYDQTWPSCIHI